MATLTNHNAVAGTHDKHNEERNSIAFSIIFVSIFTLFMGIAIRLVCLGCLGALGFLERNKVRL